MKIADKEKDDVQTTTNENVEYINRLRQQKSLLSTRLSSLRITCSKKKNSIYAIFDEFEAEFIQSVN